MTTIPQYTFKMDPVDGAMECSCVSFWAHRNGNWVKRLRQWAETDFKKLDSWYV